MNIVRPKGLIKRNPKGFIVRCKNLPSEFFADKNIAKRYFRRFGRVKLIVFKPKTTSCMVEYFSEDSMLNALAIAGEYNGKLFQVDKNVSPTKRKSLETTDPDWLSDPDVKAEWEAMGGVNESKAYYLRSADMDIDPVAKTDKNTLKSKKIRKPFVDKPKIKKAIATDPATNSTQELMNAIKQQAYTIDDKYRILDARDKLIRIRMKKSTELNEGATIGTCPDMCPEKERLMREVQHQVALYEQMENGKGMNPKLAIKQYSRSSADQETPLPHELRPVGVLQMTMGYLLHKIMDLCESTEVNIAEWYHFLWDRTRGIRKDITQQELCSLGSVQLVEQCARFHIHCSARLVAEEPSVFDQKINTENLTKCLQTLKYMYDDLALKGIACECEAEFRAYIILLNLNDANFMWEVQKLRLAIQKSPEVQYALTVYSALDKNNFVRFFKLVRMTSYLNACILMRYFVQVRLNALQHYLKCYTPRTSMTMIPLKTLADLLAFEDVPSTIDFLETYGLYTNEERTHFVLDVKSWSSPEMPYVLDRAMNLVESKRQYSVGQIVCGSNQMPDKLFETHQPQNSFDLDGFLKNSYEFDEDNDDMQLEMEEPIIEDSKDELVEPETMVIEAEIESEPTREAEPQLEPEPEPAIAPPKPEFTLEELERRRWEQEEEERIKRELEEENCRKLKELRRQRVLFMEKMQKERDEFLRKQMEEKQRLEKIMEDKRRIEEEKEKQAKQLEENRKSLEIKQAVIQTLDNLLEFVENNVKMARLEQITKNIKNRLIMKYINKWRLGIKNKRQRKRKALEDLPMWLSTRTTNEEAEELYSAHQRYVLSDMKRYRSGVSTEIVPPTIRKPIKFNLRNIFKILLSNNKLRNELFWKINISLPITRWRIESLVDKLVGWTKQENDIWMRIENITNHNQRLVVAIEKRTGLIGSIHNDSNAHIFIGRAFDDEMRLRIVETLKNYGVFVKVPLVLILEEFNESDDKLKILIEEGIISDYLIIIERFTNDSFANILNESLEFLAKRYHFESPLEMDTLENFLNKHLCTDLWKKIKSYTKWNTNYKISLKNPNLIINLFNEALTKLEMIVIDDTINEFQKFPDIFQQFLDTEIPDYLPCDYRYFPRYSCEIRYKNHLKKVLDKMVLPKFLYDWPCDNREDLDVFLRNFCENFKNSERLFYKFSGIVLRDNPENIVWSDLIEVIAQEKLGEIDFTLYGTGFVNQSIFNQLTVVYNREKLLNFGNSNWFYVDHPLIRHRIEELLQQQLEWTPKKPANLVLDNIDLDALLEKYNLDNSGKLDEMNRSLIECEEMIDDLESSMIVHRKIDEKSGDLLNNFLK